jgi:hypothetical protein
MLFNIALMALDMILDKFVKRLIGRQFFIEDISPFL